MKIATFKIIDIKEGEVIISVSMPNLIEDKTFTASKGDELSIEGPPEGLLKASDN